MSLTASAVAWTYLAANGARGLFYLPQLRVVLKCRDAARNVSLASWAFFALSHASAFVYAVVCVDDGGLALMSAVNVAGSGLIAGSIAWKRFAVFRGPADAASSGREDPAIRTRGAAVPLPKGA